MVDWSRLLIRTNRPDVAEKGSAPGAEEPSEKAAQKAAQRAHAGACLGETPRMKKPRWCRGLQIGAISRNDPRWRIGDLNYRRQGSMAARG